MGLCLNWVSQLYSCKISHQLQLLGGPRVALAQPNLTYPKPHLTYLEQTRKQINSNCAAISMGGCVPVKLHVKRCVMVGVRGAWQERGRGHVRCNSYQ